MSTDIQTTKLPVNITSNSSQKNAPLREQNTDQSAAQPAPTRYADTVSMTDKAARLKAIESSLASIPQVNDSLVAEISQSLADGNLEIDLERIAGKLVEFQPSASESDAT